MVKVAADGIHLRGTIGPDGMGQRFGCLGAVHHLADTDRRFNIRPCVGAPFALIAVEQ